MHFPPALFAYADDDQQAAYLTQLSRGVSSLITSAELVFTLRSEAKY